MEKPINQRIKFLLESLSLSARDFSRAIGVPDNNTQNYLEPRFAQPKADYLEKVMLHFGSINPTWLLTGHGEPFTGEAPIPPVNINNRKNKGPVQNNTGSHATITNNVQLDNCQRDLEAAKRESESLKEQLAAKDALLAAKDVIIAGKDELLMLLRGSHNRPN